MKEGTLTAEERREYLGIAIKRSNQLSKLVSALFELAKLDSPDVQVRVEPFSLGELIQDILQKFQLTAGKKKIALQMNIEKHLPLVFGDIGLIERVIENLIDNALRYTSGGGSVRVTAQRVQRLEGMDSIPRTPDSDADLVEISVADTGSGISPEDIPAIFDRYQRGRSHPDISSGSGFGLTIAKRILELHKSDLAVKSTPKIGTIFTFTLPTYKP
jgi:two-component system, OmpR family, sensor kinase